MSSNRAAAQPPELADLQAAVPEDVLGLCRTLREHGQRGWVVGGCLRDQLLGRPAKDWDIATDARPDKVMRLFRRAVPTGIRHGTVTVLVSGRPYELTTLRGDGAYGDGRRPDRVVFLDDIDRDLARRDFTFNAIALDPLDGNLIDPFDGRGDIARRTVRAVGDPRARFAEDGLRILRAARFAATLGFDIEAQTLVAMGEERSLETFARVSPERIRDEWLKSMQAQRPSIAFEIMRQTGMLERCCPELLPMVGCQQNRWHSHDVWEHTMRCVDACGGDPVLRLAALLHDVGKPATRQHSPRTDDYTFYDHEAVGAKVSDAILRRLRLSGSERQRVVDLVRHHLVCYAPDWTDAAVRRWIRRVGPHRIEDQFQLAIADCSAKGKASDQGVEAIEQLRVRVATALRAGTALSARDLDIDGHVLMQALGLEPGPLVGRILAALVELVTEHPDANQRERLLDEARHLAAALRGSSAGRGTPPRNEGEE